MGDVRRSFGRDALTYLKDVDHWSDVVLAASVVILVIHKNFVVFGRLRIRSVLLAIFILYAVLIAYEAYVVLTCVRIAGPPM